VTAPTTAPTAPTTLSTWAIDSAHSSVEFSVKHLMVSTVKGRFHDVAGVLGIDEQDPSRSSISAAIRVASVDTGVGQRDDHLRSDDFFNAASFPEITFKSTKIDGSGEAWRMTGDLTIRDVTRPVELDVEFEGRGPDAWGGERAGFSATTKINRKDFGVNWNAAIEAGGFVVGDQVKIAINIEAVKQAQA
jgi:polyisoprenoid-binding protein YceI